MLLLHSASFLFCAECIRFLVEKVVEVVQVHLFAFSSEPASRTVNLQRWRRSFYYFARLREMAACDKRRVRIGKFS